MSAAPRVAGPIFSSHRITSRMERTDGRRGMKWKDETFEDVNIYPTHLDADAYVTFTLKPDRTINEARMAAVSPLTDFSFDFQDLLFRPVAINARPK
jgi:hypothetical protein